MGCGAGRLGALGGASEVTPRVDTEVTPPSSSVAVDLVVGQAVSPLSLGDGPGGACVVQSQGDEAAKIDRRDAVMKPGIVLGRSAVAQSSVAAHDPGDAAFDHRPVLAVDHAKFGGLGLLAGSQERRIVVMQLHRSATQCGRAPGPQRAAAAADAEHRRPGSGHRTVCPAGQLT